MLMQQLQQNTGDYSRENVILTGIKPVMTAKNSLGKSSQYRQFAIRVERDYELDDGTVVEQQPLDLFCTSWQPDVLKALDTIELGDRLNISGYLEPTWHGYIATDSPKGIRFPIPDVGSQPFDVPNVDLVIQPTAHPYRLDAQQPGVYVHPAAGLNVMVLAPATSFSKAAEVVAQQSGNATSAFEQLQQQQDSLNTATAPDAASNGDANPHVGGVVIGGE